MIKTGCINTPILNALSHCMHGDKVLITTANFRFNRSTKADVVYLGLRPNQPTTLEVLESLKDTINIEKIELRALDPDTPTHHSIKAIFPDIPIVAHEQPTFHAAADADDVALIIVTGGTEYASNILLTVDL